MKIVGDNVRFRGFTLVELIVTLAVLSFLATIAVPSFQRMIASNRSVADYNEVLSGLLFSRSEAVKRRDEVTFEVVESSPWKYEIFLDADDEVEIIRVADGKDASTSIVPKVVVVFNELGRLKSCSAEPCLLSLESKVSFVDERFLLISPSGRLEKLDAPPPVEEDDEA